MPIGIVPSKSSRKPACNTVQHLFRQQKAQVSASKPSLAHQNQTNASLLTPGSAFSNSVIRTHSGYQKKASNERLTRPALQARVQAEKEEQVLRLSLMSTSERDALKASCASLTSVSLSNNANDGDNDIHMQIDPVEILNGGLAMDISHAGGELSALLSIGEDLFGVNRTKYHDYRTRRNRVENRNMAFNAQMDAMVDSYMAWAHANGEDMLSGKHKGPENIQGRAFSKVLVMDTFYSRHVEVHHGEGDKTIVASVIRHGYIPCSPLRPSVAFTVRTLQMYQTARNRCPQFSMHSFIKTLCDLYQRPFKRSLSRQFSICLDLYLELRRQVHACVMVALQRDSPDWRLRNACAACTYKLEDEKPLKFKMLYTVDGNDSLKRIARRETAPDYDAERADHPILGASSESIDSRRVGQGLHLTKDEVDSLSSKQFGDGDEGSVEDGNPCAERWRNMKTGLTAKMWGVFEETGVFVALCRHGFSLLTTDMVRSGELSKYPIAIVSKMIDAFGEDLALGYDIGCRFSTTLSKSPIASKVKSNRHHCLVGAFHGHAHNRLCQSKNLATYVEGVGLEGFETCEPHFSESNKMAASTRHASEFHHLQTFVEFTNHRDRFEKYQNLSTHLLNNYKQALSILDTKHDVMETLKRLGAESGKVVEKWLKEEEEYLSALKREPPEETLEMEYFVLLGNLMLVEDELARTNELFAANVTPQTIHLPDKTQATETARRHLRETHFARLSAVQSMEKRMGIVVRWTMDSEKWRETEQRVVLRQYQRSLDTLEGLVVARMFELTKMNMSQTGYSLRKHIAAALKSRSKAIRTALVKYNTAAAALKPPRQELTWEEVVDYAFLADFDLLRDCRQDIRSRPWATPAARHALDRYFKLLRAAEEIDRLNIEIHRLWTFIKDEDAFLLSKEKELSATNPTLASAIHSYRSETSRFIEHHTAILNQIRQLKGYTGKPGSCFGVAVSGPSSSTTSAPTPPASGPPSTKPSPAINAHLNPPNSSALHDSALPHSPISAPVLSIPAKSPTAPISDAPKAPNMNMDIDDENDEEENEQDFEQDQAGEDQDEAVLSAYTSLLIISDDLS